MGWDGMGGERKERGSKPKTEDGERGKNEGHKEGKQRIEVDGGIDDGTGGG